MNASSPAYSLEHQNVSQQRLPDIATLRNFAQRSGIFTEMMDSESPEAMLNGDLFRRIKDNNKTN